MFSDKKSFFGYIKSNQMLLLISPLCSTIIKYIYWELLMLRCATNIGTIINISAIGKALAHVQKGQLS
jgi:hypothetical protein